MVFETPPSPVASQPPPGRASLSRQWYAGHSARWTARAASRVSTLAQGEAARAGVGAFALPKQYESTG